MEEIKNTIEENRGFFESDSLPKGHKERLFKKMESKITKREGLLNSQKKLLSNKSLKYYIAAAVVLAFIIISPLYKYNNSKGIEVIIGTNYVTIINEKSAVILSMIETLDPLSKEMVLNTLDQLIFEAIPFDEQLPQSIDPEQRNILEQSYYNPKLEGIEKLKGYVSQLLDL